MIDPAIDTFFKKRKEAWLTKNIKSNMQEEEAQGKRLECDHLFSPEVWLPKAAKRAGQMSLATHPCTFSHPSARKNRNGYATPVLATADRNSDGFLRSGNVPTETDALGNAAALDVYKFLTLKMEDSRKLVEHIQADSDLAKSLLTVQTEQYQILKDGFLAIMASADKDNAITSSKVKQVYFPVDSKKYHILSLLSNSGIIYELRSRIDEIRFSETAKEGRKQKRNNEYFEQGFSEIYNLTTIGYGGTKPQNISVLNNQHGGKAHLLPTIPPTLQKRNIRFPRHNFFGESFRYFECRDIFQALHKLFLTDYNNKRIREGRDYRLQDLMERIIARMWAVREVAAEQYRRENSDLKPHQRTWLCEEFRQLREEEDAWLDKLCKEITAWIIRTYEKVLGRQALKLDESIRLHVYGIVAENREDLR